MHSRSYSLMKRFNLHLWWTPLSLQTASSNWASLVFPVSPRITFDSLPRSGVTPLLGYFSSAGAVHEFLAMRKKSANVKAVHARSLSLCCGCVGFWSAEPKYSTCPAVTYFLLFSVSVIVKKANLRSLSLSLRYWHQDLRQISQTCNIYTEISIHIYINKMNLQHQDGDN